MREIVIEFKMMQTILARLITGISVKIQRIILKISGSRVLENDSKIDKTKRIRKMMRIPEAQEMSRKSSIKELLNLCEFKKKIKMREVKHLMKKKNSPS